MRFSVLIENYCSFLVFDDFLCSFVVSNRPQHPPPQPSALPVHIKASSQKPLFSLAFENTPAVVFKDSGIVWVIHLLFL